MIIQVQRESGLANRTIILTQRQVRLLRRGAYAAGSILAIVVLSWFFLATQAARVPGLTRRVQTLQHDVTRLDTLQAALTALEGRFQQVQHMLGASTPQTGEAASAAAASTLAPGPASRANHWNRGRRWRRESRPRQIGSVFQPARPMATFPVRRIGAATASGSIRSNCGWKVRGACTIARCGSGI